MFWGNMAKLLSQLDLTTLSRQALVLFFRSTGELALDESPQNCYTSSIGFWDFFVKSEKQSLFVQRSVLNLRFAYYEIILEEPSCLLPCQKLLKLNASGM